MENKFRKFYVDWWNIKKSTVYGITARAALVCLLLGGGWRIWHNDSILPANENANFEKDSARIVSKFSVRPARQLL